MDRQISQIRAISSSVCQLSESLKALELQRDSLQASTRYKDSEKCLQQLTKVRSLLKSESQRLLVSQQLLEKWQLEVRQKEELTAFAADWDQKLSQKDVSDKETIDAAIRNFELELVRVHEDLTRKTENRPKFSPVLLSLRETEKRAAKSGKFADAEFAKRKADILEREEAASLQACRKERLQREVTLHRQKQQCELLSLQHRLDVERSELLRVRESETDTLHKKFKNARMQLEAAHSLASTKRDSASVSATQGPAVSPILTRILNSPKSQASAEPRHRRSQTHR